MTPISVYLGILILALIIGNGLLSLTKGYNGRTRRQMVRNSQPVQRLRRPSIQPPEPSLETVQFESKLKALDELTKMAHGRLNDIEEGLRSGKPVPVEVKANGDEENAKRIEELKSQSVQLFGDINEKISKLDNFRANTAIELQGVKAVAEQMKNNLSGFPSEGVAKSEENLRALEVELGLIKQRLSAAKQDSQPDITVELDDIQVRLEKLHTFKTNTEVELRALKEIVVGLKNELDRTRSRRENDWVKSDGKAKNFDQYLEKFRRVSLGMKNVY